MDVKENRINNNLSQKDLSKLIGVPVNTIYKWEKGTLNPGKRNLVKLEAVFAGERIEPEVNTEQELMLLRQKVADQERIIETQKETIKVMRDALERIAERK